MLKLQYRIMDAKTCKHYGKTTMIFLTCDIRPFTRLHCLTSPADRSLARHHHQPC